MEPDKSLHEIAQFLSSEFSKQQIKINRKIARKNLINVLNYINFQNETILLNFKHIKNNSRISLTAKPLPCFDKQFECLFMDSIEGYINKYELESLFIAYDDKFIMVKPEVKTVGEARILLNLPDLAWEVNYRENRRYASAPIEVELIQDSILFHGKLLDFSVSSFRILTSSHSPNSLVLLNPNSSLIAILKKDGQVVFSGECKIVRKQDIGKEAIIVIRPLPKSIHRFKPKKYRSERVKLFPAPSITFRHPLSDKSISLEVDDLSGAGLSVIEEEHRSTLFPGLILPELKVHLGGDSTVNTTAQVLYRTNLEGDDGESVKYGIAFIDMDINDQARISNVLQRATNAKLHVCTDLDLESLWKLFFETGFIYPKKYAALQNNKDKFKELYEKLYLKPNDIIRHFVYQERGKIFGHISMVRFYQNSWLFHHHSARNSTLGKAGISVLRQISQYANDFSSLHSTHMGYIMAYFRPENKFPARVFGGFAAYLNNRQGCSIDEFAYRMAGDSGYPPDAAAAHMQQAGLELSAATRQDLVQLQGFYGQRHGGLLLDALDLQPGMVDDELINQTYQELGIQRQRKVCSLTKNGELHAIIMIAVSDIGLNLSNLTNCLHVIVVDPDDFYADDLFAAVSCLFNKYNQDNENEMPVLIHPLSYVEREKIDYDKIYNFWVLNTFYGDDYFTFIESMLENHKTRN